jgi:glutamine synthetase
MKPRALYKDPFRLGDHVLVMCDTYTPAGAALPTNTRAPAMNAFSGKEDEVPWFGLEQEYTLFNLDQTTPLGWPKGGFPGPQGPYCEWPSASLAPGCVCTAWLSFAH